MANEVSVSQIQGLLIPGPYCDTAHLWAAQSSYTQEGPIAGQLVTSSVTTAALAASGTQDTTRTWTARCQRGGGPGQSGWVWRYDSEAWRGWDVPSAISYWDTLVWTDGTGLGTTATYEPCALGLPDGSLLVAYRETTGASYRVRVAHRTRAGVTTTVTVYSSTSSPAHGYWPQLLRLPTGRVLLYHYLPDPTTTTYQLRMWYSDDDGDTWTLGGGYVLSTPLDVSGSKRVMKFAVGYAAGEMLLIVGIDTYASSGAAVTDLHLVQYASSDEGCTWTLVDESDASTEYGVHPYVVYTDGVWSVYYLQAASQSCARRLTGSAYASIFAGAQEDVGSTGYEMYLTNTRFADEVSFALCVDENGEIYVHAVDYDFPDRPAFAFRSTDGGETWLAMGQGGLSSFGRSVWHNTSDGSTYVRHLTSCVVEGRVVVVHQWGASPATTDNSIGVCCLGGYSTVTLPGYARYPTDVSRVGWETTYLPLDLPGDAGWWTAAGTGTQAVSSSRLELTTSSTSRYYTRTPPGTVAEGYLARTSLRLVSGGALLSDDVAVAIRLADGTDEYSVSVRAHSTGVRVVDNVGAVVIGNGTIDTSSDIDLLIAVAGASVRVWARARSWTPDRVWTLIASSDALVSDTGTPAATSLVAWGHVASSTSASYWYEYHDVSDEWTGYQLAQGQTSPDDLFWRTLGPDALGIDDGLRVAHTSGSAYESQTWTSSADYDYPLAHALPRPYPSPRIAWRTTGTAQTDVALAWDPDLLTIESQEESDLLGIYLGGINWRTGSLWGYDVGTAAWVKLIDLDASVGSLPYTRQGITLRPDGVTTVYLSQDEYAGATVDLGTSTLRRVASHSGGLWTSAGVQKKPVLLLTDPTGTEPASGTATVWATQIAAVISLRGATYAGYRLRIDSQSTVDGYLTVGALVLGPVLVLGNPYGRGWSRSVLAGVEVTETEDRVTRSRIVAPPQRTVTLGWTDPVAQGEILGSAPDPRYLRFEPGGQPVANRGAVLQDLEGLVYRLQGPHTPVVWLPRLPTGSQTQTVRRRDQLLYGRTLGESVERQNVLGLEGVDEYDRGPTLTIREEV